MHFNFFRYNLFYIFAIVATDNFLYAMTINNLAKINTVNNFYCIVYKNEIVKCIATEATVRIEDGGNDRPVTTIKHRILDFVEQNKPVPQGLNQSKLQIDGDGTVEVSIPKTCSQSFFFSKNKNGESEGLYSYSDNCVANSKFNKIDSTQFTYYYKKIYWLWYDFFDWI